MNPDDPDILVRLPMADVAQAVRLVVAFFCSRGNPPFKADRAGRAGLRGGGAR